MKPYTYLIRHKPTDRVYYGVRTANKHEPQEDLWHQYFTSSPKIQQLIEETGQDSFDVEIRRVFKTKEQAVAWETRVLRRCRVLEDERWINQNVAGYIVPTEESRKKISDYHTGKAKSQEHKKNLSESLRVILDQRKILCAPAGCSLMGLAKNALDAASVPGRILALSRKRQYPSADANGSPWDGGLERGGRHGLKPMLRPPSTSSGRMPTRSFAWWLSVHGMVERRANAGRGFVWAKGGRAGMPGLHFG